MSLDCYETELLEIFEQENINYLDKNKLLTKNISILENNLEEKIPLITHQIYLTSPLKPKEIDSISLRKTLVSLNLLNAVGDWKHYVWTNNLDIINSEINAIKGVEIHLLDELKDSILWQEITDIIEKAGNDKSIFAMLSDLIRYSALEKFGGLYRDLDYEIYKPSGFLKLMQNFHFFGGKEFDYEPSIWEAP